jgi:hypothetical protein
MPPDRAPSRQPRQEGLDRFTPGRPVEKAEPAEPQHLSDGLLELRKAARGRRENDHVQQLRGEQGQLDVGHQRIDLCCKLGDGTA